MDAKEFLERLEVPSLYVPSSLNDEITDKGYERLQRWLNRLSNKAILDFIHDIHNPNNKPTVEASVKLRIYNLYPNRASDNDNITINSASNEIHIPICSLYGIEYERMFNTHVYSYDYDIEELCKNYYVSANDFSAGLLAAIHCLLYELKNCEGTVNEIRTIKHSESVINSSCVRNSYSVNDSHDVINSKIVRKSMHVKNSEMVHHSETVVDSKKVTRSKIVVNSDDVSYSTNVRNSSNIRSSKNIHDSLELTDCENVSMANDKKELKNMNGIFPLGEEATPIKIEDSPLFEVFKVNI